MYRPIAKIVALESGNPIVHVAPRFQTCDAIAATTKKLEKTALVAAYLKRIHLGRSGGGYRFSFRRSTADEEMTLQVGGALIWRIVNELSGEIRRELTEIYRKHGDAGSVAAEALPAKPESRLSLTDVQQAFSSIATARGPAAKAALLRELLERATPLEAKYIVKIISGDLRIGLKESLVEEAIARAFEAPLDLVKARQYVAWRSWRNSAPRLCWKTRPTRGFVFFIPSTSCSRVRWSLRKRR